MGKAEDIIVSKGMTENRGGGDHNMNSWGGRAELKYRMGWIT